MYLSSVSISYKQPERRFWDQEQGQGVKEQVARLPHGKLSEKATLTLEQFVAELKKRIQDKETQKNNQSLPKKNLGLPKRKNINEKQKIRTKQVQQKNTSKVPKTSSLNKSKVKNGPKKKEKKDLERNNKSVVKKQNTKSSSTKSVPKLPKHPKFNIPKESFQHIFWPLLSYISINKYIIFPNHNEGLSTLVQKTNFEEKTERSS